MGLHKNITESELHVPGYVQSGDPGAIGAGKLWVDTSGGTGNWVVKIRNDANDDWEEASGGGGGGTVNDGVLQVSGGSEYGGSVAGESPITDQNGNQILGRTAVRHWLDPHPDAASFDETWEFSTTGDMTQGQLESAGWTFTNCTGVVSNGMLWLSATSSAYARASIVCSLTGDFDLTVISAFGDGYGDLLRTPYSSGGFGVGDSSGDVQHSVFLQKTAVQPNGEYRTNGTVSAGGGTDAGSSAMRYGPPIEQRIWRTSGTVRMSHGPTWPMAALYEDDTSPAERGWETGVTLSDSRTFDRIILNTDFSGSSYGNASGRMGFFFLRRFQ